MAKARKSQARKLQEQIASKVGVRPNLEQLAELLKTLFDITGKLKSSTEVLLDLDQIEQLAVAAQTMLREQPNPPPTAATQTRRAPKAPQSGSTNRAARQGPRLQPARGNALDPNVVVKLNLAIARDALLSRKPEDGGFGAPTLSSHGDLNYAYPDPNDDLLEDEDRFYRRGNNRIPVPAPNLIVINEDQKAMMEKGRFKWRSNQLWNMLERLICTMWVVDPVCKECKEVISDGFQNNSKRILTGKIPVEKVVPPTRHDACFGLAHVLRDLNVRLQGMDEDDPETIALRSAAYVDAVNDAEAFLLEKEINVPVEVLIDRFTIIINVRKRGARNAS